MKYNYSKVLFSIIIWSLTTHFGFSQNTIILDSNFEQALIDKGYDNAPIDGVVPTANINTIIELIIESKNIDDLTGIEDFTALERLLVKDNNLTSLDVSQNLNLFELSCSNNNISDIKLPEGYALEGVFLHENKLTTIDLSGCKGLDALSCGNNLLTTLDISQNLQLKSISCVENQLTELNLRSNTLLESIYVNDNQLNWLDLNLNLNLIYLACSGNNLFYLNLTNNKNITKLDCSNNILKDLDLTHNTKLREADLSANRLTCLNIKNGYNLDMIPPKFHVENNLDLTCIEVDDPEWCTNNWINRDDHTSYSSECENYCLVDVNQKILEEVQVFPNPTTSQLNIRLRTKVNYVKITLLDSLGKKIIQEQHDALKNWQCNFDKNPSGVYFLKIETTTEQMSTTVIIQK